MCVHNIPRIFLFDFSKLFNFRDFTQKCIILLMKEIVLNGRG